MWLSGCLGFHYHYHYLSSYTGFLVELILNCPILHIVLYLHNNHPTWPASCIFQISLGSSGHQFHNNVLCIKQNLIWANVLFLSLRLRYEINSPSFETFWNYSFLPKKKSTHIYSKLHFNHKSSVVPRSDNDFCASLFTIMLKDYALLRLSAQIAEEIGAMGVSYYYYIF